MLRTLRVKNIALVEALRVDFGPGLNMITGETGAGKSILMGALGILLGERADKTMIRSGEDACGAEAVFELEDTSEVDTILEGFGIEPCQDQQLLIRRIVRASGSNQTLVNDSPVTLQVLKRIGEYLVDMHGPHDHQSLFHLSTQLDILDAFGHVHKERDAYAEIYEKLKATEARINELQADDGDVAEQVDILSYRVKEIEEAALKEGEEEEIREEHQLVGHSHQILELSGNIINILTEAEPCVFDALAEAQRYMDELARLMPDAQSWQEELRAGAGSIQELSRSISSSADRVDADPSRLEWLDQRLATYQKMKRKHGPDVADVLETLNKSKARLRDLETRGEQLDELEKERATIEKDLLKCGTGLRRKRALASTELAQKVTDELKQLGFPHGSFEILMSEVEPGPTGIDEVEFSFAPNVGEPARALRAIASSGEISRVMLATKAVIADHDRIPVLVFDEIDANVGGEMGHAVGSKLAKVAEHHQVICITHLPQVARFGEQHLAVTKYVKEGRTFSNVDRLDNEARVEELARMLGGKDFTKVTLTHAREMLEST
ncbi:MAG: DNA repair protein RecN [Verrucomicrobia bacterium]|nr:DNA repair protein RecN [Verrucomicrobiota bacterium]